MRMSWFWITPLPISKLPPENFWNVRTPAFSSIAERLRDGTAFRPQQSPQNPDSKLHLHPISPLQSWITSAFLANCSGRAFVESGNFLLVGRSASPRFPHPMTNALQSGMDAEHFSHQSSYFARSLLCSNTLHA